MKKYIQTMVKNLPILASLLLSATVSFADDSTNAAPVTADPAPAKHPIEAGAKALAPTNDVGLGSDGALKDENSYQARIGELYAPGGEAYILPIRIPALPDGQRFQTVHLRTQLMAINNDNNGLASADFYGLGVRDTEKVLPTDYYQGSKPDTKATLIQAGFLTPASKPRTDAITGPFIETSADADIAFAKYLNDICSKPGNAGKYLFLRINYAVDTIPDGNNAYSLLTSGADGEQESPLITYTLTPAK